MPKGIAITIGLNSVDPQHYAGWSGDLVACESDARDMALLAKNRGMNVSSLLTADATRERVAAAVRKAATTLTHGDFFLLTYSGHGGQVPDLNSDEDDGQDETWCLFDGELIDDEIFKLLSLFAAGIRVVVLSDSCHSGSVVKMNHYLGKGIAAASAKDGPRYRAMPLLIARRTFEQYRAFYEPILQSHDLAKAQASVKASVLLLSGCQDNQLSSDGAFNGLFTGTLLSVWNSGKFKGTYREFHKAIRQRMPPDQTPNYFWVPADDKSFEKQQPFTV